MFTCPCCVGSNTFPTTFMNGKTFLHHFTFYHGDRIASGSMVCPHSDCIGRQYDKMNSFRKHVLSHKSPASLTSSEGEGVAGKRKRSDDCLNTPADVSSEAPNTPADSLTEVASPTGLPDLKDPNSSVTFDEKLNEAVIAYLASLYDCGHFTETQIQHVVQSQTNLLGGPFFSILKDNVFEILKMTEVESGNRESELKTLSRMFDSFQNMFKGYETAHQRLSEFEKCGAYIKPESFVIGQARSEKTENGRVVIEPITLTGQFVPFRHVLKAFLELPGVLSEISQYVSYLENSFCESGPTQNIMQGTLWREKIRPRFPHDCLVLPAQFYFDDYETNKELGFKTGVHKLGAGYFKLACLPPKFAAAIENIFLAVLFHSGDRAFGNKKVFRKVITELKFLEDEGISVVTEAGVVQVRFALAIVKGDNLGVNAVLGFFECFVANFFCRICFEPKATTKTQIESNPEKRRTKESYQNDLETNNAKLTGRKEPCEFNVLVAYDVSENVSVDPMHDLDSGVWKYDMYFIIKYLFDKKRFSVEYLNELIQSFPYGCNDVKNKMPYITKEDLCVSKRLRCSASQTRCLVRYFGLMVGHLVKPEDKPVWELYLKMRAILDIVTAPVVYKSDSLRLKLLIREHHALFMNTFDTDLKPKYHMLTHYPEVLLELGPLDPLCCYREEQKHQEGKDIAHASHNRVNLPLTIAKRSQLKLAFRFLCRRGFRSHFDHSLMQRVNVQDIDMYSEFRPAIPPEHDEKVWNTVKSLKVNGSEFHLGCVVLHSLEGNLPVFGKVHVIVISESDAHLVLQVLNVKNFDSHYHAYEVQDIPDGAHWLFVNVKNLLSHLSTNVVHRPNGKAFVPFRFSVSNCIPSV